MHLFKFKFLLPLVVLALIITAQNCSRFSAMKGKSGIFGRIGLASTGSGSYVNLEGEGCNNTAFAQDPNDLSLFWGRMNHYSGQPSEDINNKCTWTSFTVGSYRLDINTKKFKFLQPAFDLPLRLADGRLVTTAYDPTIVEYRGERWITFECHGPQGFPGSVGACMGPIDRNNRLIASRSVVVVDGLSADPNNPFLGSASVPKLLADGSQLYLFWTQVLHTRSGEFQSLKTWGARLEKVGEFYWLEGASSAQHSDSPLARKVFGLNHPEMADASEFQNGINHWLMLAHIGGSGCVLPLPAKDNCYVLRVGWVPKSIEHGSFDNFIRLTDLPAEFDSLHVQYPRLVTDPLDGSKAILVNVIGEPLMRWIPIDLKEPSAMPAQMQPPDRTLASLPQTAEPSQMGQQQMPSGTSPQAQVDSVTQVAPMATESAQTRLATRLFLSVLKRNPDAAGLATAQSMDCLGIANMVAHSPEANSIYTSLDNNGFINYLYDSLLMRAPDSEGFAFYQNALQTGTLSRSAIITGFIHSPEFLVNLCNTYGL